METGKKEREKEEEGEIVGREKSMGGRKGGRERDSREGEGGGGGKEKGRVVRRLREERVDGICPLCSHIHCNSCYAWYLPGSSLM